MFFKKDLTKSQQLVTFPSHHSCWTCLTFHPCRSLPWTHGSHCCSNCCSWRPDCPGLGNKEQEVSSPFTCTWRIIPFVPGPPCKYFLLCPVLWIVKLQLRIPSQMWYLFYFPTVSGDYPSSPSHAPPAHTPLLQCIYTRLVCSIHSGSEEMLNGGLEIHISYPSLNNSAGFPLSSPSNKFLLWLFPSTTQSQGSRHPICTVTLQLQDLMTC